MSVPTGGEMADALRRTGKALSDAGLLKTQHVFHQIAAALKTTSSHDPKWAYEISESNPLEFTPIFNSHLNKYIRPRIYAGINVQKCFGGGVCFTRLDLALDVLDEENVVLIKHHIDLANSNANGFQDGPLFHLQFGGHTPHKERSLEVPLKEPRWLCIPLDVVLLCEVVVANFYPKDWEKLKQQPSWHDSILASQIFCVVPFVNELQQKMGMSTKTLLDHLWASTIGTDYKTTGLSA